MTLPPPPIILIIDDDATIGRSLKRLADQTFAGEGFQSLWVKNGVAGVAMARQYADQLRLIVLDSKMQLLNGALVAARLRQLVPQVPIMPFTSHAEALPALVELGCVVPTLKQPTSIGELPARMRQAMRTPVQPLPAQAWVQALQQSADDVLAFVAQGSLHAVLATDGQAIAQVQRAMTLLDKYSRRVGTPPAREIQLARKALAEVGVD